MATVSGTVSEATGGKFANGAMTGAFVHMFNAEFQDRMASRVAFGDPKVREGNMRMLSNGAEKVADVAGAVVVYGAYTKNAPLTIVAEVIDITATTAKYIFSPDNHTSQEIMNSYLPVQYQSTDLK